MIIFYFMGAISFGLFCFEQSWPTAFIAIVFNLIVFGLYVLESEETKAPEVDLSPVTGSLDAIDTRLKKLEGTHSVIEKQAVETKRLLSEGNLNRAFRPTLIKKD
jgi:hypothetical protein